MTPVKDKPMDEVVTSSPKTPVLLKLKVGSILTSSAEVSSRRAQSLAGRNVVNLGQTTPMSARHTSKSLDEKSPQSPIEIENDFMEQLAEAMQKFENLTSLGDVIMPPASDFETPKKIPDLVEMRAEANEFLPHTPINTRMKQELIREGLLIFLLDEVQSMIEAFLATDNEAINGLGFETRLYFRKACSAFQWNIVRVEDEQRYLSYFQTYQRLEERLLVPELEGFFDGLPQERA